MVEIMQRSFSQHGKIASLPGVEKRLKAQRLQIELIRKNMKCQINPQGKDFSMESYLSTLDKIKDIAQELWIVCYRKKPV